VIKITSATKCDRGIYMFHWMLMAPQALKSIQSKIPLLLRNAQI